MNGVLFSSGIFLRRSEHSTTKWISQKWPYRHIIAWTWKYKNCWTHRVYLSFV